MIAEEPDVVYFRLGAGWACGGAVKSLMMTSLFRWRDSFPAFFIPSLVQPSIAQYTRGRIVPNYPHPPPEQCDAPTTHTGRQADHPV